MGSWAELRDAVGGACVRYDQLGQAIRAKCSRTERNLVLFNLCARSSIELTRIHQALDDSPDLIALPARNLFELNIIVRYVLTSDENLARWVAEVATDERAILEGILKLSQGDSPEAERPLRERLTQIDATLKRQGKSARPTQQVSALATAVNLKMEYDAFFKLYSKYVHPSSWFVNSPPERLDEWKSILALQAQLYAADTFARISAACGVSV
jgi:hypothetical protein